MLWAQQDVILYCIWTCKEKLPMMRFLQLPMLYRDRESKRPGMVTRSLSDVSRDGLLRISERWLTTFAIIVIGKMDRNL